MTMVFWGFFFSLLNFNLNFGTITIPLLPTAVGYIVLYLFAKRRGHLHEGIEKSRILYCVLSIISVIDLVMMLTGITLDGLLAAAVSVAVWVLSMIAGTNLLKGLSHLGAEQGRAHQGKQITHLWMAVVILNLLVLLLAWMPVINVVLMIADIVLVIVFLVMLYGLTSKMSYV